MKDSLKGVRPAHMTGPRLDRSQIVGTRRTDEGRKGVSTTMITLTVLMAGLVMVMVAYWGRGDKAGVAAPVEAPQRRYMSSRLENVVVADFQPSTGGKYSNRAAIRLVGKGGLEVVARPPMTCDENPIVARVGRVIRVRSDTWQVARGSAETVLSETDAEAALCGSFAGRDVARRPIAGKISDR